MQRLHCLGAPRLGAMVKTPACVSDHGNAPEGPGCMLMLVEPRKASAVVFRTLVLVR